MRDMLSAAGFVNIQIQVKENAADIIKDWMPGSGAEKYVTSAYVTATKRRPLGIHDDVRRKCCEPLVLEDTKPAGPGA